MDARLALVGLLGIGALVLYARRSQSSYAAPAPVYAPFYDSGAIYTQPTQPAPYAPPPTSLAESVFDFFGNLTDIFYTPESQPAQTPTQTAPSYYEQYDYYDYDYSAPRAIDWGYDADWGVDYYTPQPTPPQETYVNPDENVAAFLKMIKYAEGTDPNGRGQDPYRITYGYNHVIQNMTDHPSNTGEWPGVQTQWGLTTASGAYQFTRTTWNDMNARWGRRSFSPADQDARAIERMADRHALEDVRAGRFQAALDKLGNEWASLPTSTSGQPQRRVDEVISVYENAGGSFA